MVSAAYFSWGRSEVESPLFLKQNCRNSATGPSSDLKEKSFLKSCWRICLEGWYSPPDPLPVPFTVGAIALGAVFSLQRLKGARFQNDESSGDAFSWNDYGFAVWHWVKCWAFSELCCLRRLYPWELEFCRTLICSQWNRASVVKYFWEMVG